MLPRFRDAHSIELWETKGSFCIDKPEIAQLQCRVDGPTLVTIRVTVALADQEPETKEITHSGTFTICWV